MKNLTSGNTGKLRKRRFNPLLSFFIDCLDEATKGRQSYHIWMACLSVLMFFGTFAYVRQIQFGLGITGMNDHVSWGLYISNFTFLVGIAAASVLLVIPTYIFKDYDFSRSVLIGEGMAVAALLMCLAFVVVDMGGPARLWHIIPGIGFFNWPQSMLAWDVIVLNGYLLINLAVPFYLLFSKYRRKTPNKKAYVPLIFLSMFWAVSIHLVTAFLYAGLVARPFWNSSVLGPRFLASAFAAGGALMYMTLYAIHKFTDMRIALRVFDKLSLMMIISAQINLIMLGSEIFKEFYYSNEHSESAHYLFFGLDGHDSLNKWIYSSITMGVISVLCLMIPKIRSNPKIALGFCAMLFISIWIEKGMGLIIPGFIPGPLGHVVDYYPTSDEIIITVGIWAMGIFIFSIIAKIVIALETGKVSYNAPLPEETDDKTEDRAQETQPEQT